MKVPVKDFATTSDGNGRWIAAYWDSRRIAFVVSVEGTGVEGTPETKLAADDVRDLGLWCIDAYEAFGLEFPGLERL